jgi:L-fuconolactonase
VTQPATPAEAHVDDTTPAAADDVVDSHVHVWDADRVDYPWLAEVPQLARRYDLGDVGHEQTAAGIRHVVLVQAADSIDDTELMLATAAVNPSVAGVVAWVPIDDAPAADACLTRWKAAPIVGARHLVHRHPDPDLLVQPRVAEVLDLLADRGLAFDVCAESESLLRLVPLLAERHANLDLVVDHLAKPPIRQRGWEPWASLLSDAASAPNVVVKLSGLNTAAAPDDTAAAWQRYVDHALEVFGPDRTMYGGDWPFALLAATSYTEIWSDLRGCLEQLDPPAQRAVLATTARRIYRLPAPENQRAVSLVESDSGEASPTPYTRAAVPPLRHRFPLPVADSGDQGDDPAAV